MIPSSNRGRLMLLSLVVILFPLFHFWEDFLSVVAPTPPLKSESASSSAWNIPDSDRKTDVTSDILKKYDSYEAALPLFEAVKSNDLQKVRSLLDGNGIKTSNNHSTTKIDVNAEDPKGLTPIIEATLLGATPIINLLLSHGAHAQPLPGFRHTPLRAACLTANIHLITLLLDNGADPNAMSEGGRTPLMGACYLRPEFDKPDGSKLSLSAVKTMMEDERTDPTIKNSFGESALDLCRERGYAESVEFLGKVVEEWERKQGDTSADSTNEGRNLRQ